MSHTKTTKTTRLNVRVTAVERGILAEAAGPHGTLSSVVRMLIDRFVKRQKRAGLLCLLIVALLAWPVLAIADGCTSITIVDQQTGTMRFCQSCCYGGACTMTCL